MHLNRRTLLGLALSAPVLRPLTSASAQDTGWTLLDDSSGPIARWDHVLLADPASNRLFLFGGRDGNGTALADFWVYDLESAQWTELPGAPAARFGSAASTLLDGSGFLLFGGQADVFFNDLWAFDFGTQAWTLLDDGATTAPSPRYGLAGAFDADGRYIVSHGFTFDGRFDDTWAWGDAGGWVDISPAPESRRLRRCLHELQAIDGDHLILYAGCSSGYGPCPQGDLWLFTPATDTWIELSPAVVPAPRTNPALSVSGDSVLLVGGSTPDGPAADVWTGAFDGADFTWAPVDEASGVIPGRSSHDMAIIDGTFYLFGGLGIDGALADLWQYAPSE